MRSPIKLVGSKAMLAGWIIQHFPPHEAYIEVFGGSAAILFSKRPVKYEVYNDLDRRLVTFFRVLRDPRKCDELLSKLELTPYSVEEYYAALDKMDMAGVGDIELAYAYFIASRQGFGGKGQFTAGWSHGIKRDYVFDWLRAVQGLPEFSERMTAVQVECEDFEYILYTYDSKRTLFYLDPPYLGIKEYAVKFTSDDHKRMLDAVLDVEGMMVISGYDNDMYDELLLYGWHRVDKQTKAYVESVKGSSRRKRVESLWLSPQVADWVEETYPEG